MSTQNQVYGSTLMLGLLAACAPLAPQGPEMPAPPETVTNDQEAESNECIELEAFRGDEASLLRYLEGRIAALAESLERPLCMSAVRGLSLSDASEPRMSGNISVRDTSRNTEVTVRVWARRSGSGILVRWEERYFSETLAQELALAELPTWLASQNGLRSFSRMELVTGTWLLWLRRADDSTLCLQTRGEELCWRESGQVTRIVPYEWTYHVDDPESGPEGFIAVFRDNAGPVFSKVRTHPELSRAHALPEPFLGQARPSWWPSPYLIEPRGEVMLPRWRALALVETPNLGPLLWLQARRLHVPGRERVVERQDSIVVARGGRHRLLCARQQRWTCSRLLDVEDGSNPYLESVYLDAFDVDGTSIALVRSVRQTGGDVPGSDSRADAYLDVWERGELLEHRGSVHLGRATWRVESERARFRQMERVLHHVHVESDGCFRIDAAMTEVGETDYDFNMDGSAVPLNLARAGNAIEFSNAADGIRELRGHWRLGASGLTRVNECSPGPRTLLAKVTIPPDLPPPADTCLAVLNERIDEMPPLSVVTGNACGATERRHGVVMGRQRFRYAGDRRVETVRVYRIQPGDDSRYVERERPFWRNGRRAGYDTESIHFRGGEEECGNTHWRRETLDRQGRPTRIRSRSETCEGVFPGEHVERRSWHHGDGFDAEAHDSVQHYYVPSYAESSAEVTCARTSCSCHVDVRDETGRVRVRLESDDPSAGIDSLYQCATAPWPVTAEALRVLSIEADFEDPPSTEDLPGG